MAVFFSYGFKVMPEEQLKRTVQDTDEEGDVSPLLKGLLIALIPSAVAWAALIYSAVKLGHAFHH
jgi:hypothetical protein